VSNYVSYLGPL